MYVAETIKQFPGWSRRTTHEQFSLDLILVNIRLFMEMFSQDKLFFHDALLEHVDKFKHPLMKSTEVMSRSVGWIGERSIGHLYLQKTYKVVGRAICRFACDVIVLER
jgi:hypothetical protein